MTRPPAIGGSFLRRRGLTLAAAASAAALTSRLRTSPAVRAAVLRAVPSRRSRAGGER